VRSAAEGRALKSPPVAQRLPYGRWRWPNSSTSRSAWPHAVDGEPTPRCSLRRRIHRAEQRPCTPVDVDGIERFTSGAGGFAAPQEAEQPPVEPKAAHEHHRFSRWTNPALGKARRLI